MRTAFFRSAATCAFASLLAACAPALHTERPSIALPPAFESSGSPSTPRDAVEDRWWEAFGDPQLAQLAGIALEQSTTIRIALARLEQARATRALSRAGTLPTGSLTGAVTESGSERAWGSGLTAPSNESVVINFAPSWELDLFGRLSAIRQRADVDRAAATYDFYGVRLALVADVAINNCSTLRVPAPSCQAGAISSRLAAKSASLPRSPPESSALGPAAVILSRSTWSPGLRRPALPKPVPWLAATVLRSAKWVHFARR